MRQSPHNPCRYGGKQCCSNAQVPRDEPGLLGVAADIGHRPADQKLRRDERHHEPMQQTSDTVVALGRVGSGDETHLFYLHDNEDAMLPAQPEAMLNERDELTLRA